jgi:hypothetical protein
VRSMPNLVPAIQLRSGMSTDSIKHQAGIKDFAGSIAKHTSP